MALFVFGGCLIRLPPRVPAQPAALILRLRLWVHAMTNEPALPYGHLPPMQTAVPGRHLL